jgi:hypothetical protein
MKVELKIVVVENRTKRAKVTCPGQYRNLDLA